MKTLPFTSIIGGLCLVSIAFLPTLATVHAGSATWNLNPTTGDWNVATNWTPATVPNGVSDIATFGMSNTTHVSLSATTDLDSIIFENTASVYSFMVNPPATALTFYGAGVMNNSGLVQNISASEGVIFRNNASAGEMLNYVSTGVFPNSIIFYDSSSAASASFNLSGSTFAMASTTFYDSSTPANASFTINAFSFLVFYGTGANAATITNNPGGYTDVNTSADQATFIMNGAASIGINGGITNIYGSGGEGLYIINGGLVSGAQGGHTVVTLEGDAADGTYIVNGGAAVGAEGGVMSVYTRATAGDASITVNGGTNGGNGGLLLFTGLAHGGTPSITLHGNGSMDLSGIKARVSPLETGSLAGEGIVALGARQLEIGTNNESTIFSGIIQDEGATAGTGGSLSKVGTGTFTLIGASTYTGGTTVSAGALVASNTTGSATGTGAVVVNAGALGGGGTIAGAVIIGTGSGSGAMLQPGFATTRKITLTIQSLLTFKADATYTSRLKSKAAEVTAGGVTIENGAQFVLTGPNRTLPADTTATVIKNTAATPISGTFANLPDGATITSGNNTFQANYEGGFGNDLTLTVLP